VRRMNSKALAVAGLIVGLTLAMTEPAAAAGSAARPGTTAPTALPSASITQAVTTRDVRLDTFYFDPGGTWLDGPTGASVKLNLAVRGWYTSSTAANPYRVDAAARAYDLGNSYVGNVQVDSVTLFDSNGIARSGPCCLSNSNGGAMTGLIAVPGCGVTTGTGRFFAGVHLTWRNAGVLEGKTAGGRLTAPNFRTTGCSG
jgi:hypothetical protein